MAQGLYYRPAVLAAYKRALKRAQGRHSARLRAIDAKREEGFQRLLKRHPRQTGAAYYDGLDRLDDARQKARSKEWRTFDGVKSRLYDYYDRKAKAGWTPRKPSKAFWAEPKANQGGDLIWSEAPYRVEVYYADSHSSAGWRIYKGRKEVAQDDQSPGAGWINAAQAKREALAALKALKAGKTPDRNWSGDNGNGAYEYTDSGFIARVYFDDDNGSACWDLHLIDGAVKLAEDFETDMTIRDAKRAAIEALRNAKRTQEAQ